MAAEKRRLADYSIETEQEVLVTFADRSTERLQRSDLRSRLHPDDYSRIAKAFRLRQSFWRRNLPGGLAVVMAGATAAAAMLIGTDRPLLHLVLPSKAPASAPAPDLQAARVIPTPSPSQSATAQASPTPASFPAASPAGTSRNSPALIRRFTNMLGQMLK